MQRRSAPARQGRVRRQPRLASASHPGSYTGPVDRTHRPERSLRRSRGHCALAAAASHPIIDADSDAVSPRSPRREQPRRVPRSQSGSRTIDRRQWGLEVVLGEAASCRIPDHDDKPLLVVRELLAQRPVLGITIFDLASQHDDQWVLRWLGAFPEIELSLLECIDDRLVSIKPLTGPAALLDLSSHFDECFPGQWDRGRPVSDELADTLYGRIVDRATWAGSRLHLPASCLLSV
jgi:hypothetical protein